VSRTSSIFCPLMLPEWSTTQIKSMPERSAYSSSAFCSSPYSSCLRSFVRTLTTAGIIVSSVRDSFTCVNLARNISSISCAKSRAFTSSFLYYCYYCATDTPVALLSTIKSSSSNFCKAGATY
jgi:hypothetical protein